MDAFEVRPCGPEQTEDWAKFLNENFGYHAPYSYAVDFAPLFAPTALERSRLIIKDGRIVASATLYPVRVLINANGANGRELSLAVVGAVATAKDCRGQGLSSRILRELEEAARAMKAKGLVLWSDQEEFYAKAGYEPAGRQLIYSLENLPAPKSKVEGTPVYGWDWNQVRSLYERHALRVARTDDYWKALGGVTSVTRVQWVDLDGKVLAYLGFDRGRDLHGIIHEWGGEPEALHLLVWTVLQNRPNLMWLTHPELADPIRKQLPPECFSSSLALFKPLEGGLSARDLDQAWFWGLDSL